MTGLFRAGAARANYLALNRPDVSVAAKELCRRMSAPMVDDLASLKRQARYLMGAPRQVYNFPQQDAAGVDVYADTDWVGCLATRRGTPGGCAVRVCTSSSIGHRLRKPWS